MITLFTPHPSFAIHPGHQDLREGDPETGGKMRVIRRAGRWLSVALLAGAFSLPMATDPAHAASCATLKKEFTKQIRPTILRLAKKEFHLSNWYHATLKKQQSGKYPTLADFKATHTLMLAKCKSKIFFGGHGLAECLWSSCPKYHLWFQNLFWRPWPR